MVVFEESEKAVYQIRHFPNFQNGYKWVDLLGYFVVRLQVEKTKYWHCLLVLLFVGVNECEE